MIDALLLLSFFSIFLLIIIKSTFFLYWNSDSFKEMLEDEISYFFNIKKTEVKIGKITSKKITDLNLSDLEIFESSPYKADGSRSLKKIYDVSDLSFKPRFSLKEKEYKRLIKLRMEKNFNVMISISSKLKDLWSRHSYNKSFVYTNDVWKVKFINFPHHQFINLILENKFSYLDYNLINKKNIEGTLSGIIHLKDTNNFFLPLGQEFIKIKSQRLRFNNLDNFLKETPLKIKDFSINILRKKQIFELKNKLQIDSNMGNVMFSGTISFESNKSSTRKKILKERSIPEGDQFNYPYVQLTVSSVNKSYLFEMIKKIFSCKDDAGKKHLKIYGLLDALKCKRI